jgi:hypothetical protein
MSRRKLLALIAASVAGAMIPSLVPTVASADSVLVYASDRQCVARWLNNPDKFHIDDLDITDNDYCYVQYGYSGTNLPNRISHPQDVSDYGAYPVNTGSNGRIYWKVCKERQDDPDICSAVVNHVT